jgi:hypothetical protein
MAQRLVRACMPGVQGTSPSRTRRGLLVAPWKAQKREMAYVAKGCLDCA